MAGILSNLFANSSTTLRTPAQWLVDYLGGGDSGVGIAVNTKTAMHVAVYFACIRNISEDIGKLPYILYRQLEPRGKERARDLPLYAILRYHPNEMMSAASFQETMTHWALAWGNGFAEIIGDYPDYSLWPLHPCYVEMKVKTRDSYWYEVRTDEKPTPRAIMPERMFHLHGLGDGLLGYSVAMLAKKTLGIGLASQESTARMFKNGWSIPGILKHPKVLRDIARDNLRKSFNEVHAGPENAWKPMILEEGMEWQQTGSPAKDAQWLELQQFGIEEICRWFRMPLNKVQHFIRAQGWSTLDAQNTDYVTDTLMPWLVRWEQETRRKLIPTDSDLFAEHMLNGLLRGDMAARSAFYRERFNIGTLSPNDIREFENENPIEDGDRYFIPANLVPLSNPVMPQSSASADSDDAEDAIETHKRVFVPVFAEAINRVVRKEASASARLQKKHASDAAWSELSDELFADFVEACSPMAVSLADAILLFDGRQPLQECHRFAVDAINEVARHYQSEMRNRRNDAEMVNKEPPRWACIATDAVADAVMEYCDENSPDKLLGD